MKIIVNWRAVHRFSPKWLLIVTKWLAQRSFKAGTAQPYRRGGENAEISAFFSTAVWWQKGNIWKF